MTWQDAVIAVGQALFAAALVPALLGTQKPPRSTCALTGLTLLAFAAAYGSLDLWGSASAASVCGVLWLVLLWQQRRRSPTLVASGRDLMLHRDCGGGVIVEDHSKSYSYEGCAVPALRCVKCGNEITGDKEIELSWDDVR